MAAAGLVDQGRRTRRFVESARAGQAQPADELLSLQLTWRSFQQLGRLFHLEGIEQLGDPPYHMDANRQRACLQDYFPGLSV